jgi:glycogen debranching enzyme
MEVIHYSQSLICRKSCKENVGFNLSNNKGSYASFFNEPSSKYQGLFFFDSNKKLMFKAIENIELKKNNKISKLINKIYCVQRKKKSAMETFYMPKGHNAMLYELSMPLELNLILDCKNSYDDREWGRNYEVTREKGLIIVKFAKKTDNREDSTEGEKEYEIYIAVKSDNDFYRLNDSWIERNYRFDAIRNSKSKRFAYNSIELIGRKFVFSASSIKKDAVKECKRAFKYFEELKIKEKEDFEKLIQNRHIKNVINNRKLEAECKLSYINSVNSLKNLIVDDKNLGLFAGLPWFFQYWARDSLISLKALCKIDKDISKKIFQKYLSNIRKDGRLDNISDNHSKIMCADAHGFMFLRAKEFINKIDNNELKESLETSIEGLMKFHTADNFELNDSQETWMDTNFNGDDRKGARIEIQALRLNIYKFMHEITKDKKYEMLEQTLKEKVKGKFWNSSILADGIDDFTIRPNSFIAHYAYPELLSKEDWEKCFDNLIKSLYLDWGGFSTIDKSHDLFTKTHTGENNKSYHRGDSWFWINNLAAISLHKSNRKKFNKIIDKIIMASTEEILWKGSVGCHSEISSAEELSSLGCFNQAWSNAMYIEMVDEIFNK